MGTQARGPQALRLRAPPALALPAAQPPRAPPARPPVTTAMFPKIASTPRLSRASRVPKPLHPLAGRRRSDGRRRSSAAAAPRRQPRLAGPHTTCSWVWTTRGPNRRSPVRATPPCLNNVLGTGPQEIVDICACTAAGQPEGGQPAGQPRPQRSVETVPLSSMVARNGSQSAAAPSSDGGGAVGQAAPIPTETPTMSFDWAAPQQPEQQQAYGAPAAIGASFA